MSVSLHWQTEGPLGAPTLVLLNSLGTSTEIWTPLLAPLREQFHVVRIDWPGHGHSPAAPPGRVTTVADLAADVLAVLDELGRPRVHLAGLSLGGMIGLWLAANHPERIDRLALVCSSAHLAPVEGWLARAATVRADGMAVLADGAIGRWLTPSLAQRSPVLVARLQAMLTSTDVESYAQCCEAISAFDLRADLGRVASPTLLIAGADDPATPPSHSEVIAAGVAGARVEILDSAAHLATVEQPGRISALLLQHFRAGASLETGYATRRAVLGDAHVDRSIANPTELSAPFQEFITRYAWGDIWTRPGLVRRERSIATLAALVALGAEHEIGLHVRAARRNGLTPAEIGEVILHTAVYAGVPRANRALNIAEQTLAEQ